MKNDENKKNYPYFIGKIVRVFSAIKKISEVVNEDSFYSDKERKSKISRYFDNYKWFLKYRRVNTCYNSFGLDIKNFRNANSYLDLKDMKKQKKNIGINTEENSIDPVLLLTKFSILADDKFLFYAYFNTILKGVTPEVLLVFKNNKISWPRDEKSSVIDFIKNLKDEKYICKSSTGLGGHSITLLTKKNGKVLINNKEDSLEEFINSLDSSTYIIQKYVYQHNKIAVLNESTLNTIRIISVRFNNKTNILAAMLRIGTDKEKIVDNASSGGTFVGIDLETGKLKEYGHFFDKAPTKEHPTSKIEYKDYEIPYWNEVIKLIENLHPFVYAIPSIGWDVAITKDGPVVIEINTDWGTKGLQIANGGLKDRWESLKKQ